MTEENGIQRKTSPLALCVAAIALAAAVPAADLTQYLDKGYAIGTDNVGRGVRVFKATEDGTQEVVWQWLCTQDSAFTGGANNLIYTSDVKVRSGGRTLLVVGATDWAVIDAASGVCSRSGHVNDGGHGIDILPDGTLIKGDSNSATSGSIWLIMDYGGTKNAFTLPSCHGVEWDNDRNCVWAIGYSHIVKLGYNALQKTLVELGRWQIPGTSGHCLDLADDGKLYFTDWSGVRRFDPDTETFTTLYALSNPKSISHSETFGDIVELPTPAVYSDGYSANKVRVYPVSGDASNYYEVTPSPQMSMYRARWLTSKSPTYGIDESVVVTEWGNVITASAGKAGKYDMTDSLKFLCAPTRSVSNWDTAKSRAMTTIYPYDGRLWTSGGDWYDNKGSSPIFAIDPSSGAFSADYIAGTETVWYFREGSDGSLYVPGVDQNERHSNSDQGGAYFQRRNDGTWVKYLSNSNQTDRILRVPFGSIPQSGYTSSPSYEGMLMHTFDLVNWKGKTFACGYGICWGVEGGTEVMTVAPRRAGRRIRETVIHSSSGGSTRRRACSTGQRCHGPTSPRDSRRPTAYPQTAARSCCGIRRRSWTAFSTSSDSKELRRVPGRFAARSTTAEWSRRRKSISARGSIRSASRSTTAKSPSSRANLIHRPDRSSTACGNRRTVSGSAACSRSGPNSRRSRLPASAATGISAWATRHTRRRPGR